MILNGTWNTYPGIGIFYLFFLVAITLIIEGLCVWAYAKWKGYKDIDLLLGVIVLANLITGFLGYIIGVIF